VTDEKLEAFIGIILRTGVLAAALIVAASGTLYLSRHYADPPRYGTFAAESANLRSVGGILRSSLHFQSDAMIQLGLLLLIATPIARVAFAAIGFYLEHDHLYVVVSLIVLAILLFSLVHSV
jgi:uncharacterized membrane protein